MNTSSRATTRGYMGARSDRPQFREFVTISKYKPMPKTDGQGAGPGTKRLHRLSKVPIHLAESRLETKAMTIQ